MSFQRIAVLIPCHNEALPIAKVVADFAKALPQAVIYVYDNNSTDDTALVAGAAGAEVRSEPLQGKGNVVRRMFADVEADVYLLVDGDDTYSAAHAPQLVQALLTHSADMVTAVRVSTSDQAYRPGHVLGNRLLTGLVAWMFGDRVQDMLSGYRVFSRRFVKSFPALAHGFEIETELTVHALELRLPMVDVPTPYQERPQGSTSKLRTFRDGFRILGLIVRLVMRERPVLFFGGLAALCAVLAVGLAVPLFVTYAQTGLVPRFPTAILSAALMIVCFLLGTVGLILDQVTHARRETKRLAYLSHVGPKAPANSETAG